MIEPRRVVYIHQDNLQKAADALPSNKFRASLVHSLITSLDLLEFGDESSNEEGNGSTTITDSVRLTKARVVESKPATRSELEAFHDEDYVSQLLGEASSPRSGNSSEDDTPSPTKRQKLDSFGLSDDCPVFEGLSDYALEIAGASLQAARELRDDRADIAIHWNGGRHHARRSEASGFCYVQDIVLSILELRSNPKWKSNSDSTLHKPKKLSKSIYIDLDLHHGDGVEMAFKSTPHVLTLSLHLHSPYFFPSTGSLNSTGPLNSNSSFHALNLALHPGLSNLTLLRLYFTCIEPILNTFIHDVIVIQCGCDGLAGDPCKEWNLGLESMGQVIKQILERGKKTLLFGGGGYENANAARCWSYLTAIALERTEIGIESLIPPDIEEFELFKPSFTLDVPMGNMRDQNTEEKLVEIELAFKGYVEELKKKYPS